MPGTKHTDAQVMEREQSLEYLMAEITRLRQRVAELESVEQQLQDVEQQLQDAEFLLRAVYHEAPYTIVVHKMAQDGKLYYVGVNQTTEKLTGIPVEQWVGKRPDQIFPPDVYDSIRKRTVECLERGDTLEFEEQIIFPVGEVWTNTLYIPLRDNQGNIDRMVVVAFDITNRKHHELEELTKREAIIHQQSATLNELSTPLLTISNQIVVMPLIGAIDSLRVQHIMDTLLSGIAESRASVAIIDITGLLIVDTQVASSLIQVAQAIKLLGAQVILTGIRPEIAQTLVGLGINLDDIVTRSTLQTGIAYALRSSSVNSNSHSLRPGQ